MKKIALILTGGTIGSKNIEHIIDVGEDTVYQLVSAYEEAYGEKDIFEVFSPFQSLSENFTKTEWQKLCDLLWDFPFEKYEGVVIAHGTDTLSYTAALVAMLFADKGVPITLIASNYPIGAEGSNGVRNLRGAVNFIRQQVANGVFVVYENAVGDIEVFLGTRLLPADNVLDQYGSFAGPCFGVMKEEGFFCNKNERAPLPEELKENRKALLPEELNQNEKVCSLNEWDRNGKTSSLEHLNRNKEGELQKETITKSNSNQSFFKKPIHFTRDILFLMPYPGQNYQYISLDNKPAAVFHYLYHAGTACVKADNYSFLEFLKRCQQEQIPCYVASIKAGSKDAYATGNDILQQGAIPLYDISPIAGYMKLLLAYNQTERPIEEVLGHNFFYEQV